RSACPGHVADTCNHTRHALVTSTAPTFHSFCRKVWTVAVATSGTPAVASRNSTTMAYATACTSKRKALAQKPCDDKRSQRKPFFISPIGCSGTAALRIQLPVDLPRRRLQVGHHKTSLAALGGDLDLGHHPSGLPPTVRLVVAEVFEASLLPAHGGRLRPRGVCRAGTVTAR